MLFFSLPRKFDILSVFLYRSFCSVCCCSVAQLCLTLCDPTDCNTPGLPVPRPLLKFAQVHFHCVSDAIQPSHPLTPSSSALNLSQHQGLFQWVSCSHQVTKALPMSIQGWSPCCPVDSQESSPAPPFKGINSLALSLLYSPALTTIHNHWEDHSLDYTDLCWQSIVKC